MHVPMPVVSADEKIPFKEHRKGLDTFVEVEPGAEYFLSVQRVGLAFKGCLGCRARVDGEEISNTRAYFKQMNDNSSIHYLGISVFSNDTTKIKKALQFVTVPVTTCSATTYNTDERSAIAASGTSGMGKIELDVSEVIEMKYRNRKTIPYKECFSVTPRITVENEAFIIRNKDVRSVKGNYTYSQKRNNCMKYVIKKRKLLYTITLHYCATPGLIAVGILPKPPLWQYQRQLFPERLTANKKQELEEMNVVSVTRNSKGIEVIEIHDDHDDVDTDNDNEESKSDGNDDQPFKPSTLPPKFSARANAIFYG